MSHEMAESDLLSLFYIQFLVKFQKFGTKICVLIPAMEKKCEKKIRGRVGILDSKKTPQKPI